MSDDTVLKREIGVGCCPRVADELVEIRSLASKEVTDPDGRLAAHSRPGQQSNRSKRKLQAANKL